LIEDCWAYDGENPYITDANFIPTGGSVLYTCTIYADSLWVADKIKSIIENNITNSVLIIDNLYTSTDISISDNPDLSKLLLRISEIKRNLPP